jgi:hypothetical protein
MAIIVQQGAVREFIGSRLDSMSGRPAMWAGSKESFILQLVLLAEISHLGTPERFSDRQQAMMAELCGATAGCSVPINPITPEWASQAVIIARRYVMP